MFDSWTAEASADEIIERMGKVQPYQPVEFYNRELPCILAVLKKVGQPLYAPVVGGHGSL